MAPVKPWFRIHNSIVDNQKIQELPDRLVRPWLNLVALANQNGGVLPGTDNLVFRLRAAKTKVEGWIETFLKRRLLDKTERGIEPHDWNDWQYKSDVSTERVKAFRERHGNDERNVSETVNETDQSRDRAETEQKSSPNGDVKNRPAKGTRLANDWKPDEAARAYGVEYGLTDPEIDAEAAEYLGYFTGADANKPVKKDWSAAWKRWIRGNSARRIAQRQRSKNNTFDRPSVTAARDRILVKAGVRPEKIGPGGDNSLRFDQAGRPESGGNGEANPGPILDADEWQRVPGPADGTEITHEAVTGHDGRSGSTANGVSQTLHGLSSGRGEACAENPTGNERMVAGVERVEGSTGNSQLPQAHDARRTDDSLEIPAFLKRA